MASIITSQHSLHPTNMDKIVVDLNFIKAVQAVASDNHWRVVLSGGYGLDLQLGQITRSHGDVDLILYSQAQRSTFLATFTKVLQTLVLDPHIEVKEEEFFSDLSLKSKTVRGNLYLVQTALDPLLNIQQVVTLSGRVVTNTDERFPPPVRGKLDNLEIEVTNPNLHLADILNKRKVKGQLAKHDSDILYLERLTDKRVVNHLLTLM